MCREAERKHRWNSIINTCAHFDKLTHIYTHMHVDARTHTWSFNRWVNLVSSFCFGFFFPGPFREECEGCGVRAYEIAYIKCRNVFANGLEHIKLKMNSGSPRHHVALWLSLHFPFSLCSIIATAVTFRATVALCARLLCMCVFIRVCRYMCSGLLP